MVVKWQILVSGIVLTAAGVGGALAYLHNKPEVLGTTTGTPTPALTTPPVITTAPSPSASASPSPTATPTPTPTAAQSKPRQQNNQPATSGRADVYQVYEHFNGNSLNYGLWEPITYPKAYRNNEEQDYRPTQVGVADGMLQLHAVRDANGQWHSGEVHSKWNYAYGEFEVRMRVSATGPGVWPAAWLMGTVDQWPNNGEIDIIENVNGSPDAVGTIHGGGSRGHWHTPRWHSPVDIRQFHTYKIVKQPGYISWWVDGVKRGEWYRSQTPAGGVWPFENHRNFGLLNLAIGGNWPGPSNASTPNVTMYVDFFHVKNAY